MRRRPSPGTTAKISESSWAASLQTPPSGAVPPWRCSPGGGPAWALSDLLRGVRDRTKDARLGAMAAGNLLARKRPRPGPDRRQRDRGGVQAETPDCDEGSWDDVRTAMQDDEPKANGAPFRDLPHWPSRGSPPGSSSGAAGSRHYRLDARTLGCLTALRDIPALHTDMPTSRRACAGDYVRVCAIVLPIER